MANEDEEMFVPAYKKYNEMRQAIIETSPGPYIESIVNRLSRMGKLVPKREKTGDFSAVIPSRLGRLKNRLGEKWRNAVYGEPKTHFEPVYSEAEKKEREELKEALEGFEPYEKEKGPGVMDRLKSAKYELERATSMGFKSSMKKPTYSEEELRESEGLKSVFGEFEEYSSKDSKEYGVKDRMMDIGAAIAKVKSGYGPARDKLENYVELEDKPLRHPEPTGSITFAGGGEDAGERYIVGKETIGLPVSKIEETSKIDGGTRKSYKHEAHKDKLLRRRKINELSQYAPEHSGR